jgi:hypothetical protein
MLSGLSWRRRQAADADADRSPPSESGSDDDLPIDDLPGGSQEVPEKVVEEGGRLLCSRMRRCCSQLSREQTPNPKPRSIITMRF